MSFPPVSPACRRRGGVALVIVLAFVVLLTGLIVAFFSRALSDRQISDSSANETRVDVFAAGAVNTVLGDFRQEIAAGSNSVFYTDMYGNVIAQVYLPFNSATAAPAQALKGSSSEQGGINFSNPSPYAPNLIKRSAYSQNFFPAGSDTGSGYYNSGNTSQTIPVTATPAASPPNAPAYPPSNRAANVATTAVSQNGRSVSLARWNKSLLLPKNNLASDTDFTPLNPASTPVSVPSPYVAPPAGTNEFVAPDWVLVARDGSNPTGSFNSGMVTSPSNSSSVIGRYAYAIYDEGGLLDANAAGFPNAGGTPTVPLGNSPSNLPLYKGSLTFADLKQLTGISALSTSRQEQVVRTLLGWRNYASIAIDPTQTTPAAGSPVTGSVNVAPGYQWSSANILNFLNFAPLNGTGFLHTANPLLINNQSDRLFGSRQQLLDLLLQSVADQSANGTAERANLQNAMQCLGTFSRSLNQPSYVPPAGRPKVAALTAGGNSEGPGNDDAINPAFLNIRVTASMPGGRNDGTDLVQGEPLVKKRFPLSRLAWLTYKGPSKGRTGDDINDLKTNFGYTQAFLDQGDDATVLKYFGLTFNYQGGYWTYTHAAANTSTGLIMTLKQVRDSNREPDFIELLKAAITAGALGKTSTSPPSPTDSSPPAVQFNRDSSIDFQVIQLAANIIDQFDVDGYPTRIQFFGREFRGVENLPYFYRVRNGLYRLDNPAPLPPNYDSAQDWYNTTVTHQGTFIMVEQPEIWNPHAYDATSTATINRSMGYPRPTNLRLVVYGAGPQTPPSKPDTGVTIQNDNIMCWWEDGSGGDGGSSGLSSVKLNDTYTQMKFLNVESLYREPTLLIKPGVPANSQLQALGFFNSLQADGLSAYATADGGVHVLDAPAMAYGTSEPSPGIYSGIYLGKNVVGYPGNGGNYSTPPNTAGTRVPGQARIDGGPTWLTYQIQCDSATGVGMDVYDEKYFGVDPFTDDIHLAKTSIFGMLSTSAAGQNSYPGRHILGLNRMMTFTDPRTSRFGVIGSETGDNNTWQDREFAVPGLKSPGSPRWIDQANNVVSSNRPDNSAGFGMTSGPTSAGWTWSNSLFRFGLFSQNNPAIPNDDRRFVGDTDANNFGVGTAQYYADADGVVRRATGAYVKAGTTPTLSGNTTAGLPMATAYYTPANGDARQKESRPIILNRPFRSVAELGSVFSDIPWKNIDFATPESGYAALLDVFCVNDTEDSTGKVAGKVDLNTRQTPVLQAVLSGAYRDEYNGAAVPITAGDAQTIASNLLIRTTSTVSGKGPLANLADLVGGWKLGSGASAAYDGFSADLTNADLYNNNIPRYRESAVRALAAAGNTRVWNLMIDLVAQTGRYPQSASGLDKFVVEGEQRYWVHVAIDRFTGQVIDKQVEVVKE